MPKRKAAAAPKEDPRRRTRSAKEEKKLKAKDAKDAKDEAKEPAPKRRSPRPRAGAKKGRQEKSKESESSEDAEDAEEDEEKESESEEEEEPEPPRRTTRGRGASAAPAPAPVPAPAAAEAKHEAKKAAGKDDEDDDDDDYREAKGPDRRSSRHARAETKATPSRASTPREKRASPPDKPGPPDKPDKKAPAPSPPRAAAKETPKDAAAAKASPTALHQSPRPMVPQTPKAPPPLAAPAPAPAPTPAKAAPPPAQAPPQQPAAARDSPRLNATAAVAAQLPVAELNAPPAAVSAPPAVVAAATAAAAVAAQQQLELQAQAQLAQQQQQQRQRQLLLQQQAAAAAVQQAAAAALAQQQATAAAAAQQQQQQVAQAKHLAQAQQQQLQQQLQQQQLQQQHLQQQALEQQQRAAAQQAAAHQQQLQQQHQQHQQQAQLQQQQQLQLQQQVAAPQAAQQLPAHAQQQVAAPALQASAAAQQQALAQQQQQQLAQQAQQQAQLQAQHAQQQHALQQQQLAQQQALQQQQQQAAPPAGAAPHRAETPPPPAGVVAVAQSPQDGSAGESKAAPIALQMKALQGRWNAALARLRRLRRTGSMRGSNFPTMCVPPRSKARTDYLHDEMAWLAADMHEERKWKQAAAKLFAEACVAALRERSAALAEVGLGDSLAVVDKSGDAAMADADAPAVEWRGVDPWSVDKSARVAAQKHSTAEACAAAARVVAVVSAFGGGAVVGRRPRLETAAAALALAKLEKPQLVVVLSAAAEVRWKESLSKAGAGDAHVVVVDPSTEDDTEDTIELAVSRSGRTVAWAVVVLDVRVGDEDHAASLRRLALEASSIAAKRMIVAATPDSRDPEGWARLAQWLLGVDAGATAAWARAQAPTRRGAAHVLEQALACGIVRIGDASNAAPGVDLIAAVAAHPPAEAALSLPEGHDGGSFLVRCVATERQRREYAAGCARSRSTLATPSTFTNVAGAAEALVNLRKIVVAPRAAKLTAERFSLEAASPKLKAVGALLRTLQGKKVLVLAALPEALEIVGRYIKSCGVPLEAQKEPRFAAAQRAIAAFERDPHAFALVLSSRVFSASPWLEAPKVDVIAVFDDDWCASVKRGDEGWLENLRKEAAAKTSRTVLYRFGLDQSLDVCYWKAKMLRPVAAAGAGGALVLPPLSQGESDALAALNASDAVSAVDRGRVSGILGVAEACGFAVDSVFRGDPQADAAPGRAFFLGSKKSQRKRLAAAIERVHRRAERSRRRLHDTARSQKSSEAETAAQKLFFAVGGGATAPADEVPHAAFIVVPCQRFNSKEAAQWDVSFARAPLYATATAASPLDGEAAPEGDVVHFPAWLQCARSGPAPFKRRLVVTQATSGSRRTAKKARHVIKAPHRAGALAIGIGSPAVLGAPAGAAGGQSRQPPNTIPAETRAATRSGGTPHGGAAPAFASPTAAAGAPAAVAGAAQSLPASLTSSSSSSRVASDASLARAARAADLEAKALSEAQVVDYGKVLERARATRARLWRPAADDAEAPRSFVAYLARFGAHAAAPALSAAPGRPLTLGAPAEARLAESARRVVACGRAQPAPLEGLPPIPEDHAALQPPHDAGDFATDEKLDAFFKRRGLLNPFEVLSRRQAQAAAPALQAAPVAEPAT